MASDPNVEVIFYQKSDPKGFEPSVLFALTVIQERLRGWRCQGTSFQKNREEKFCCGDSRGENEGISNCFTWEQNTQKETGGFESPCIFSQESQHRRSYGLPDRFPRVRVDRRGATSQTVTAR
jgi:hypothetical protein